MPRTVAQKMGIRALARTHFVNAPASALRAIELPELRVSPELEGDFDYIHFFCITRREMDGSFPGLKLHLRPSGTLWLSWPKGRRLGSDLTLPRVIEIGYNHGLVESTCLRIDDTWSALKFTHPKKGKDYANSYGTLPDAEQPGPPLPEPGGHPGKKKGPVTGRIPGQRAFMCSGSGN